MKAKRIGDSRERHTCVRCGRRIEEGAPFVLHEAACLARAAKKAERDPKHKLREP
jgi:hypothetical protein